MQLLLQGKKHSSKLLAGINPVLLKLVYFYHITHLLPASMAEARRKGIKRRHINGVVCKKIHVYLFNSFENILFLGEREKV